MGKRFGLVFDLKQYERVMKANSVQKPKVSVICVTFNQEKYIAQAIESFVMQETDFPVEIIISDDCSTDNTRVIISKYAKKYPNIRPIFIKKNLGVVGNFYEAIQLARGEYIAFCEGDDFWTDKNKLQKQVSFLDAHPTYSLCFHTVRVMVDGKVSDTEVYPGPDERTFNLTNLLRHNFIQTNSVMYRRQSTYPIIATDALPVDWYLHLYHAKQGKIGFIDETMAVYRRHRAGVWWKDDKNQLEFWQRNAIRHIRFFECVEQLFADDSLYLSIIHKSTEQLIDEICREVGERDDYEIATHIARTFPRYMAMGVTQHVSEGVLPHEQIKELRNKIDRLNEESSVREQEKQELLVQLRLRNEQLNEIVNSKSWRITRPLRALNKRRNH